MNFDGFNHLNEITSVGKISMGKKPTKFIQKSFEKKCGESVVELFDCPHEKCKKFSRD
jgi:hypothetical protein